ncbi:hypothetical protein BPC006_II0301 [Burkholderia pseudomallei BPC006]|nr:hypothetical protein BPC006_II0301 [Burkholderia pseudomallei BPC006]
MRAIVPRRAAEAARCRRRNVARRDRSPDAAPRGGHAAGMRLLRRPPCDPKY